MRRLRRTDAENTMTRISSDAPTINGNYAATVINRAAEIFADLATDPGQERYVVDALRQARDDFMACETRRQAKCRTYGLPHLLRDLRQYITSRYLEYADSFSPITEWSGETVSKSVVETLREAALNVSMIVEERTRTASKLDTMSEKELREYNLMRKAVAFLAGQGLTINVDWDRENPNEPIDYRATVDGVEWAFELTELRLDPKENYPRKIAHPNEKRSIGEQLEALEVPLLQIPQDRHALQKALDAAVKHGSKKSKLKALNGAKYCLVLHNRQFCYVPSWEEITRPDLSPFNAVLILHQESIPPAQVWEAPRNGFGKPLPSQNVDDLADIAEFKMSSRTKRIDAAMARSAWRRIEDLELTEDDIRAAVVDARTQGGGQ